MQISTRTEYALRAMLEIIKQENNPISAREICERQQLPRKYIERLLSNLKAAGLVESHNGAKGGYILAKKSEDITLLQIMKAVEDHSWEMSCISNPPEHCLGDKCGLHVVWSDLYRNMKSMLDSYSLERIDDMMDFNHNNENGADR